MKKRQLLALVPMLVVIFATGCSDTSRPNASAPANDAPVVAAPAAHPSSRATYTAAPPVGDLKEYEGLQAEVQTDRGTFYIEFYPKEAPKTVASFVKLSRDHFYDGLTFHRVEPGFVVQGGDPEGTGVGGPGYTLPAEFNSHKHVTGAVAMARTEDPNSAGSQFYVCLAPAPNLDGKYTVFGQVTKGMDNVQQIKKGDHIIKIVIEPKSK